MSKKRFAGILLLSTGLFLAIIGFSNGILNSNLVEKNIIPTFESSNDDIDVVKNLLIVNLPAPDTIIASPLLIRGKIYGEADQVEIRLTDTKQGILANIDFVVKDDITNKEYKLLQTSLIFDQPKRQNGLLNVILKRNGQKVDEANVPIIYR